MLIERRIQQLADNIRKDMDLLNDYEDELHVCSVKQHSPPLTVSV